MINILVITLAWFSIALFAAMVIYKFVKLASMPLHIRWEIYPVAHEPKEKRRYGGSYMEDPDWVHQPIKTSLTGELLEMFSEVFFLHRVRKYNPYKLWLSSISMHWGIYLLFTWVFLLVIETFFKFRGISQLTNIIGTLAFILGAYGSFMLFIKRISNRNLSLYTAPVDYFNLMFLFIIFFTGLLSSLMDYSLSDSRTYISGIISFKYTSVSLITVLNFILLELFLIYMPFTKLFHYIAKYFTFHKILWDDAFKIKGSPKDKKIIEQLSYEVTWSAPHIAPNKTWLEEAEMTDGDNKNE